MAHLDVAVVLDRYSVCTYDHLQDSCESMLDQLKKAKNKLLLINFSVALDIFMRNHLSCGLILNTKQQNKWRYR